MLTMRKARRLYAAQCTSTAVITGADDTPIARIRYRRPGAKSFRAWIRTVHQTTPLYAVSPKLIQILGTVD